MRFASLIVGITVLLIVILVVAVPVTTNVQVDKEWHELEPNHGQYYAVGATTMSSTSGVLTVDGETVSTLGINYLAVSPSFVLTNNLARTYIPSLSAIVLDGDWTFTVTSAGAFTLVNGEQDPLQGTLEIGSFYHLASSGDFVYTSTVADPLANANSTMVAVGLAGGGSGWYFFGEGQVGQPSFPGYFSNSTNSKERCTIFPTSEYNDDGSFTVSTTTASYNSSTFNATLKLIPVDYYVYVPGTGIIPTLVSIVPLIMVVGVLILCATLFIRSRD